MKHYTSIEQSKKLLKLGLSPESADMFYAKRWDEPVIISDSYDNTPCYDESDNIDILCWSVGSLFEVMPKRVDFGGTEYSPMLIPMNNTEWLCRMFCNGARSMQGFVGNTPLEATYKMVVWLLENGYIKKED